MAHCEGPGCTHAAGAVKVVTPFGEPVVCDDHALALQLIGWGPRGLTVAERLRSAWLPRAMLVGPAVHADRVRWLEGLPPLLAA